MSSAPESGAADLRIGASILLLACCVSHRYLFDPAAQVRVKNSSDGSDTLAILQLWDYPAVDVYNKHATYWADTHVCVLVCEMTDRGSLAALDALKQEFIEVNKHVSDSLAFLLLINKAEADNASKQQLSASEVVSWCQKHDIIHYFEVSARTDHNIAHVLLQLAQLALIQDLKRKKLYIGNEAELAAKQRRHQQAILQWKAEQEEEAKRQQEEAERLEALRAAERYEAEQAEWERQECERREKLGLSPFEHEDEHADTAEQPHKPGTAKDGSRAKTSQSKDNLHSPRMTATAKRVTATISTLKRMKLLQPAAASPASPSTGPSLHRKATMSPQHTAHAAKISSPSHATAMPTLTATMSTLSLASQAASNHHNSTATHASTTQQVSARSAVHEAKEATPADTAHGPATAVDAQILHTDTTESTVDAQQREQLIAQLSATTNFTTQDIGLFFHDCKYQQHITYKRFKKVLAKMSQKYWLTLSDRLYAAFDTQRTGLITFQQFIYGLHTLCAGSLQERAQRK